MRSNGKSAKPSTLVQQPQRYTIGPKEHVTAATKQDRTSAIGEHYQLHHPTDEPPLLFPIVCHTKKDQLRLMIEEGLIIKGLAPTMNRRGEEMVLDYFT